MFVGAVCVHRHALVSWHVPVCATTCIRGYVHMIHTSVCMQAPVWCWGLPSSKLGGLFPLISHGCSDSHLPVLPSGHVTGVGGKTMRRLPGILLGLGQPDSLTNWYLGPSRVCGCHWTVGEQSNLSFVLKNV